MKTDHTTKLLGIFLAACALWLTGCATTQQQQQGQENEFAENGEYDQQGEEGYEYGDQNSENFNAGNAADLGQGAANGGEFVNNAGEESYGGGENAYSNGAMGNSYGGNSYGGNSYGNNSLAGNSYGTNSYGTNSYSGNAAIADNMMAGGDTGEAVNNATETDSYGAFNTAGNGMGNFGATDASTNSVVDQAAMGTEPTAMGEAPIAMGGAPAPMGAAPSGMDPAAGPGKVKYVIEGGTQMYQDPTGQTLIKNLEQGDHPLVWENAEWARTSDGYYIPMNGLTDRPVGRARTTAAWQ